MVKLIQHPNSSCAFNQAPRDAISGSGVLEPSRSAENMAWDRIRSKQFRSCRRGGDQTGAPSEVAGREATLKSQSSPARPREHSRLFSSTEASVHSSYAGTGKSVRSIMARRCGSRVGLQPLTGFGHHDRQEMTENPATVQVDQTDTVSYPAVGIVTYFT